MFLIIISIWDSEINTGDQLFYRIIVIAKDSEKLLSQKPFAQALSFRVRKTHFENGSCRQRKN